MLGQNNSIQIPLVLIGGGGHCKSCIDVISASSTFNIIGIVDNKISINDNVLGFPVIGGDAELERINQRGINFFITVGQLTSNEIRKRIFQNLKNIEATIATIVSPYAIVSKYARIGIGTIVHHNVVVNSDSKVGENCILNTSSIIEHDCIIGNHCHISTGSVINGGVTIGTNSFIGSNSVIKQGVVIGDNVVIGAGSVVVKNIESNQIVFGNPAMKR